MSLLKIVFCIDKLEQGGAERQFIELIKGLNKKRFAVHVIILNRKGAFYKDLEAIGNIKIYCLKRKPFIYLPVFLFKFYKLLKGIQPDIIHGYLGGTNELCLLMGKLVRSRVVWGIRASNVLLSHYRMRTRILFKTGVILSKFADLIISNSEAGRQFHARNGYYFKKMIVIHNGIDHERFYPDGIAGQGFRKDLNIKDEAFVIGLVARLDPMKGHEVFIRAAVLLCERYPNLIFICTGPYSERAYHDKIVSHSSIISDNVIFTGAIADMHSVYNGLNISVSSSSYGEGFSNTIAESMACGTPCVVTDVGDSSHIVEETGLKVPPGSPQELANALEVMMQWSEHQRKIAGQKARQRIIEHFSTQSLVKNTTSAFEKMIL